jgi:hypothetical protein
MDQGMLFERKFIDLILAEIGKDGVNQKAVADMAFPGYAKPDNKLYNLKDSDARLQKAERVTLEAAYNLAKALKLNLPEFIWRVCQELKK